jgi:ParB-like chromosome segregation protein Spo0J
MTDAGHSDTPEQGAPEAPQSSSAPAEPATPEAPTAERARPEEAESAPVSSVVHKHFVAPAMIPLDRVLDEAQFRVRLDEEMEDISGLATDIARLGQLFPIDVRLHPPDQFQVITGFRRVAALRFLQREKVLARLHTDLGDGDAMLMALAAAIHGRSVSTAALSAVRARLEQRGELSPAARDMLDKSLSSESGLGPEQVEEEVDADELAAEVTLRLGECNSDLNLLADVFGELDDERKSALLQQLRYSIQLVEYLESRR